MNIILYMICGLTKVFVLLVFLPAILHLEFNTSATVYYNSMMSNEFLMSVVGSVSISVAVFILILEDVYHSKVESIRSFNRLPSSMILFLSLLLPDILLLVAISTKNYMLCYSVLAARTILLAGIVSMYLCTYAKKFWSCWLNVLYFLFSCLSATCYFYSEIVPNSIYSSIILILANVFGPISIIIFLYLFYRWGRHLRTIITSNLKFTIDMICCNIYLIAFMIVMLFLFLLNQILLQRRDNMGPMDLFNTTFLVGHTVIFGLFYLIVPMIQSQLRIRESVELEKALDVKRKFVRFISHEMRTPLNTMMMGLKFLEEDMRRSGDSQSRLDAVADIKASCSTGVDTLNELLDYDKHEEGIFSVNKKRAQLIYPFIQETLAPFRIHASEKRIVLTVRSEVEDSSDVAGVLVDMDENKMGTVVRNLISNALKFTPVEGTVSVRVGWDIEANLVRISVTDSGPGMSPENQAKLFKSIIQFDPGKLQAGGGSGIGLFMAKEIVTLHGGELYVESEGEGCGATFHLVLPTVEAEESVAVVADETSLDSLASQPTVVLAAQRSIETCPRMLLVDDAPSNRRMLGRLMSTRSRSFEMAEDGLQAVEKVRQSMLPAGEEFDVIIMDFQMPELDGPGAAKIIREMGFLGKIYGLTGNALQEDLDFYLAAGADHVFTKPLDVDDLDRRLSVYEI